jgi:hypothetical protein
VDAVPGDAVGEPRREAVVALEEDRLVIGLEPNLQDEPDRDVARP